MSAVALIGAMFALMAFATSARADYTVNTCGTYPDDVFTMVLPANEYIISTGFSCPAGGPLLELNSEAGLSAPIGIRQAWQANAPAGLEITGATASDGPGASNPPPTAGFAVGPYWRGGSATADGSLNGSWSGFASPYFGFQLECTSSCNPIGYVYISPGAVTMTIHETSSPVLSAPNGLWQTNGWVRGQWPIDFAGDSPSGVCALSGTLNGVPFTGTTAPSHNLATWHQCSAPPVSTTVNTASYGQGPIPLVIAGTDAAGVVGRDSRTVDVDNSVPTLSFSGPTDAPSTAGTQIVTAIAGGSPSGIADIVCSVDGGPTLTYTGATLQVPVSGVGTHQVSCTAYNNAVDPNGVHGVSQTETRSLKIGVPTVLDESFARVAGRLCGKTQTRRVRCDLNRSQVLKGKIEQRVGHGRATKVSGWLGLADGRPLGGETVEVLAAPDNETGRFKPAAEAVTAANGTWTASLPAGPSRLVKASYGGTATTERSTSRPVEVMVAAKVKLTSVTPRRVAWGRTVTIKGRLLGGYLPKGGVNVRLRIGIANTKTTFGVKEHVSGSGNFAATFTFGVGDASVHRTYWFQIASLPAGDYPWAPSASERKYVQVGGHPH